MRSMAQTLPLGHVLHGERDEKISLLRRLVERRGRQWSIYYGTENDSYDVRGQVAQRKHLQRGGRFLPLPRHPAGLLPILHEHARPLVAHARLRRTDRIHRGSARRGSGESRGTRGRRSRHPQRRARVATTIDHSPTDGIPYWDTGAPGLRYIDGYLDRPADPFNAFEPVDSSAAAIGAQGLLRLGNFLTTRGQFADAERYWQAGLTILETLFAEPYLCTDPNHQGLSLHGIYHRPNGWDYIPNDRRVPCGEATMWGDYHAREAALSLRAFTWKSPTSPSVSPP